MRKFKFLLMLFMIVIIFASVSFADVKDIEFDSIDLFMKHGVVMLIIDPDDGQIDYANHAASNFYQLSIDEIESMNIKDFNSLAPEQVQREMQFAAYEAKNTFVFQHKLADGTLRDVEVFSYPVHIGGEKKLFSIITDITERIKLEALEREHERHVKENLRNVIVGLSAFFIVLLGFVAVLFNKNRQLEYLTKYDVLTGAYNRKTIKGIYDKYMQRKKIPLGFMMVDVNNLKFINDTFGHIAGDMMIIEVSNRLKTLKNGIGDVARVSGDEFVILLQPCNDKCLKEVNEIIKDFNVDIEGIQFSVSVGSCFVSNASIEYAHAFTEAEGKMYSEKAHGRAERNVGIETDLLKKLARKNEAMRIQSNTGPKVAGLIAKCLQLPQEEIEFVEEAARLQGIGHAVNIDEYISRQSISSDEEMQVFKKHPEKGYNILNALGKSQNVANGVFYHHEKYDGTGFPKGLMGEEIPIASRIIAIANALMREWKIQNHESAHALWQVIKEESGKSFDPSLIKKLEQNMFLNELDILLKSFL